MKPVPKGASPGTHGARATTTRVALARRLFSRVLSPLLLAIAVPAAANPFVQLDYLFFGGRNNVAFEMAEGVAIDPRRGEIAVANTGAGRIEIFRPDGKPVAFFEHRVRQADGTLSPGQPRGLCYDAGGLLLVADNLDPCVDALDFRGRVARRLCLPSAPAGLAPADTVAGAMARLRDGSLLVATRGEPARIHRFDDRGRWASAWGIAGSRPGQLSKITALAEAPNGDLVVACDGTDLVLQRFDASGQYLGGFGRHELGPGNFSYPSGLAITDDGRIWASDALRQSVQVFDSAGTFLGMAGQGGLEPGSFLFPSSLATDGHARLAVMERVGARLQVFRITDANSVFRVPERR